MNREEFGEYIVRWASLMINNPQSSEHEQASKELDIKYNELFDHIESIEAENKELKEKLSSLEKALVKVSEGHHRLEAKLEDIESNKVAEFSGRPHLHEDSYWVLDDQRSEFLLIDYGDDLDSKTHVTVTISKE